MHFLLLTIGQLALLDARAFRRLFLLGERPLVRHLLILVTRSADSYSYLICFGILWPLLGGDLGIIAALAIGFALELPLYKLIKSRFKRLRPCESLPAVQERIPFPDKYSFPSGHTTVAVMVACLVGMNFSLLWVPLLLWAAIVGLSRVALGVHYPADVIAGAVLGALCALSANLIHGLLFL